MRSGGVSESYRERRKRVVRQSGRDNPRSARALLPAVAGARLGVAVVTEVWVVFFKNNVEAVYDNEDAAGEHADAYRDEGGQSEAVPYTLRQHFNLE